jgi:hypothetical protein
MISTLDLNKALEYRLDVLHRQREFNVSGFYLVVCYFRKGTQCVNILGRARNAPFTSTMVWMGFICDFFFFCPTDLSNLLRLKPHSLTQDDSPFFPGLVEDNLLLAQNRVQPRASLNNAESMGVPSKYRND